MKQDVVFERYVIFEDGNGGKQYQGIEGKTVALEKKIGEVGSEIIFPNVLLRKMNENSVEIGAPYLDKPVKATIVKHMRGPKLIVFMFKRRKKVRRKKGHRQPITVVRIEQI